VSELRAAPKPRVFASVATLLVLAAGVLILKTIGQPIVDPPKSSGVAPFPSASSAPSADKPPASIAKPSLIVAPDRYGATCGNGIEIRGERTWPTRTGRATPETSCAFAFNVLKAYQRTPQTPGTTPATVAVDSVVPCPETGAQCNGSSTRVSCVIDSGDHWITCTDDEGQRVYLF
jgi:serine/threonine-protein kinase